MAGIIFEKGETVTISNIDEDGGYSFINDKGEEIIECGWDCIEKAAVMEQPTTSDKFTEKELKFAEEMALKVFNASIVEIGIKKTLNMIFDEEKVDFIIKGIQGAFKTGFDCCIEYVLNTKE
ncbi:hypothetical protein [Lachnospira sp.]|jgi:hypothetical protein|uniref:hypothetical protein n=1 Tax=Lachnospira sp. TaxID=2049031 RepID=UPI00257B4260|nr:hypothetical protein [Lachnospira sp.]